MSLRLSPFETLEPLVEKLITSADRRLAASSKRDPRPRGVLVEEVHDGPAAERRDLLDDPRAHLAEGLGRVEDPHDVLGAQRRGSTAGVRSCRAPLTLIDRVLHEHGVLAVDLAQRHPRRPRPCGWGRSCRRSRRGSAAPGAPGRPAPRAGSRVGRPKSTSASSAARIVRPVNRTSSTRTTVLPVDVEVDPGLVHLGRLGPEPDVVPVEGDVERADGDATVPRSGRSRPPGDGRGRRRGRRCRPGPRPRRPCCARGSRARCG